MSYRIINSQHAVSITQSPDNSSTKSSYVWPVLIYEGVYQFSVVATTSEGSGPAATLMYDTQRSKLALRVQLFS